MAKNDMVKIKSHLTIPQDVLEQIDGLVGKRKRSKFITEATKKELKRLKLQGALERAAGIWFERREKVYVNPLTLWARGFFYGG